MKQILNEEDRVLLETLIKEAELQTSAQIVMAIIKRSDNYAEIPWKAFSLGSSVTGLVVLLLVLIFPEWITNNIILLSVAAIFVTGTFLALLTILMPQFARLFLAGNRKETEPLQYAESLFLSHELFATNARRGVLLLVSRFERQVVILPDTGVRNRLSDNIMKDIISGMKQHLRQNKLRDAMEAGLNGLVTALCPPVFEEPDNNELSDKIIEEDGV